MPCQKSGYGPVGRPPSPGRARYNLRSLLPQSTVGRAEVRTEKRSGEERLGSLCRGFEDVTDEAKEAVTFEASKAHLSDEGGVRDRFGTKGAAGVG